MVHRKISGPSVTKVCSKSIPQCQKLRHHCNPCTYTIIHIFKVKKKKAICFKHILNIFMFTVRKSKKTKRDFLYKTDGKKSHIF